MDATQPPTSADIFAELLDFREAVFRRFDAIAREFERIQELCDSTNGVKQELLVVEAQLGAIDVRLMAIDTGVSVLNRRLVR